MNCKRIPVYFQLNNLQIVDDNSLSIGMPYQITNDIDFDFLSIIIEIEKEHIEMTFNLNLFPMICCRKKAKQNTPFYSK